MDINDLQKYLEKIDFNALNEEKVKLSEDDAYVGELYNSAIDNIKQQNVDVARIKLARVVKLDPTFEKAKLLLDRINSLESDKSFGDKMEEALVNKDEKEKKITKKINQIKKPSSGLLYKTDKQQKTTTRRKSFSFNYKGRKMTPFAFIKMQMIIIITLLVLVLVLVAVILGIRKKLNDYVALQPNLEQTIKEIETDRKSKSLAYQATIDEYAKRIEEYKSRLNSTDSDIEASNKETEKLRYQNYLYYGKYLALTNKCTEALITLMDIDIQKAQFSDSDLDLYNKTKEECKKSISISLYNSGNKLYQDFKYREAFENFNKIWDYYDDYASIKEWENDGQYFDLVYDSVYKMAKCAYEIEDFNIAIRGYVFVEESQSQLAKANKDGLLYHSAKAYAGIEDYIKAEELFKKLISESPNSELITYAKERLAAIQIILGK